MELSEHEQKRILACSKATELLTMQATIITAKWTGKQQGDRGYEDARNQVLIALSNVYNADLISRSFGVYAVNQNTGSGDNGPIKG